MTLCLYNFLWVPRDSRSLQNLVAISQILLTSADLKAGYKGKSGKNGYSVQGLIAKVKGTVANG